MGGISARYSLVFKAHPLIAEELYPDSVLRGHVLAATFVRSLASCPSFILPLFFYVIHRREGTELIASWCIALAAGIAH